MLLRKRLAVAMLSMALVMGMVPMTAFAADPITTDVVIHKLKVDAGTELQTHDGKKIESDDLESISGVVFKYWRIAEDADSTEMDAIKQLTKIEDIEAYAQQNPTILTNGTNTTPTGEDGSVTVSGLAEGKYLFGEVNGAAHNVAEYIGVPFLLELPAMQADGTSYFGTGSNALHVYPKNVVSNGGLGVKSVDKVSGVQIGGGEFSFETSISGEWVSATGFDAGLVLAGGHTVLEDLPAGSYRLVNTKAPTGYLLDNRPVYLTVSAGEVTADTSANPNSEFQPTGEESESPLIIFEFIQNPTVGKTVEGSTNKSYEVGVSIPWKVSVELPADIASYKTFMLTDQIDPRLDFKDNPSIELLEGIALTEGTHYSFSFVRQDPEEKGLLTISFFPAALTDYEGQEISIVYTTTINEKAQMGEEIENDVTLDFENNYGAKSDSENPIKPSETPKVWTGGAKFAKVNDGNEKLPGAEFKIATDAAGTETLTWTQELIKVNTDGGLFVTPSEGEEIIMISNDSGAFEIKGLAGGTYYLVESKAPSVNGVQYNKLRDPASFDITQTSYDSTNLQSVINKSGLEIPQTGGIGTAIFTIVGISLMGLAIFFLRKKKKTASETAGE